MAPAGRHEAVSRLSAALRRRVIGEEEVIGAVLDAHGAELGASFISEVFWRTYWKGWLEARPAIWDDYLAQSAIGHPDVDAAVAGRTGIDAFDGWHEELESTGWLHNWARMQFASIWVHTLGLPWAVGAAFMAARLIDADPASNTLSWRWVAGLHTAGKAYLADAERIAAMTDGRFTPRGLAAKARIPEAPSAPPAQAPRAPRPWRAGVPTVLLLGPDDLSLETWAPPDLPITAILAPETLFPGAADRMAGEDAMARAQAHWQCAAQWVPDLDAVTDWGAQQVITGFAPVGPVASALAKWAAGLPAGMTLGEIRRDWDEAIWPHCRKGYFALRQAIPGLLAKRFG